jgi:hypothetical protein
MSAAPDPYRAGQQRARAARVSAIRDLRIEAVYDGNDRIPDRVHRRHWLAHHIALENAERLKEATMDFRSVALELAAVDWHVFPLRARSKVPANTDGFKGATTDPGRIKAWWTAHPDHNVGIATGASGLLVVDLDTTGEGHCADALGGLMRLADQHGDLPATYEVMTPSGGEHWYFTVPAGIDPPPCSAGRLAPHVDIRARGGYVVAEGSVTDVGAYTVGVDEAVAEAPRWLVDLCRKPVAPAPTTGTWTYDRDRYDSYVARAIEGETLQVVLAAAGTRNHTLNGAAFRLGQLVGGGLLEAGDAFDVLYTAATRVGLTATETERTIRSGITAGMAEPRRPSE